MTFDSYAKSVLTIITILLAVLVLKPFVVSEVVHGQSSLTPTESMVPVDGGQLTKHLPSLRQTVNQAEDSRVLTETLIARETQIQPNDRLEVESSLDFSGTEQVSFSVLASDNAFSTTSSPARIYVYWATPSDDSVTASYYVATDILAGASILLSGALNFANQGGAMRSVFGTRMKVAIINLGKTTPISVRQLKIYAVRH